MHEAVAPLLEERRAAFAEAWSASGEIVDRRPTNAPTCGGSTRLMASWR
jgi:hypothetical protein